MKQRGSETELHTRKQYSWTPRLGVFVAVLALCVSIASILMPEWQTQIVLASIPELTVRQDRYVFTDVVISNLGDSPIILTDVQFCMSNETLSKNTSIKTDIYDRGSWWKSDSDQPELDYTLTLPSGDLRLIRAKSRLDFANDPILHDKSFYAGICFVTIPATGEIFTSAILPFEIEIGNHGIIANYERRKKYTIPEQTAPWNEGAFRFCVNPYLRPLRRFLGSIDCFIR